MSEKGSGILKQKELVEFATGPSKGRISVILEARRPKVRLNVAGGSVRKGLSPVDPNGERTSHRVLQVHMDEVRSALERLELAKQARRNNLAGCFVVEVNKQELLELVDVPAIQAIRLNRFHRRLAA